MNVQGSPFKAYDIRGKVPTQLNEELAYGIGRSFSEIYQSTKVVVGRDIRESSQSLLKALGKGLMDGGSSVLDIGLCGTEEVYFATTYLKASGGIMVTASHNPIDYNGMKLVRQGAKPISSDSGLLELEEMVMKASYADKGKKNGSYNRIDMVPPYIDHLLSYVDLSKLQPLKVVVNAGHGCAGPIIDRLERSLPFTFIKMNHEPDSTFPTGIPNPLLVENREITAKAVLEHGAHVGIAWDGDFDRCFFFDERGSFIEGYYVVGFLAKAFLENYPSSKIIHDPRLTWNTIGIAEEYGGIPIMCKTGHAFIKERMRREDAIYGGEMSAHHYFRDFAYCDSGMIPWLLVLEMMSTSKKPLSSLVKDRIEAYPSSGEINLQVKSSQRVLDTVKGFYLGQGGKLDQTDGLSIEFDQWRFNLRASVTEPVLRLNVESRGDIGLMEEKTEEILGIIKESGSF